MQKPKYCNTNVISTLGCRKLKKEETDTQASISKTNMIVSKYI